jgi:protein-S-isoprenylcysteine O-methyltransferase Ste14
MLPGLAYRMAVEEKLLTEQFGDEYRLYARTTKRIIPGVY